MGSHLESGAGSGLRPAEWLNGLPPGTFFWGRDVPGNPPTTRAVLSKRAANPASGIKRVAQGLYWKGYPEGHPWRFDPPSAKEACIFYAGKGAGLAGWTAVSEMLWASQAPVCHQFAVVDRRLRPPMPYSSYVRRRSQRRKDLNPLEVSVIEALSKMEFIEYSWAECMDRLSCGMAGWMLGGHVLRPERVAWAAETDDLQTPKLMQDTRRMRDQLPERIEPRSISQQNADARAA